MYAQHGSPEYQFVCKIAMGETVNEAEMKTRLAE